MKIILFITVFIVGLVMEIMLMSLLAAQRIGELERDVAYFKDIYITARDELKKQRIINSNDNPENITFKLKEQ